ncbi:hypothetical protein EV356DRAFT_575410 [Viridothelium virens]|uniref:Uncharacterized protein n=1 Tax=Viridothelium virens TaxID=1048519 RepID=A0A6A6HCN7_VIRVR|nr:hypothetical protein EV356DRAFT_575410 [Viridothelium virens]
MRWFKTLFYISFPLVFGSNQTQVTYPSISWDSEPSFVSSYSSSIATTTSTCGGCSISVDADGYMWSNMQNLTWVEKEVYLVVDPDTNETSTSSIRTNVDPAEPDGMPSTVQKELYASLSDPDCISPTRTLYVSQSPVDILCKTSHVRNYQLGTQSVVTFNPTVTIYSPTTYLGVFQWTKFEESLVTVSGTEICTQRAEILSHTGLTVFPMLPGQSDWLVNGGNWSAMSIGSLPTEAYTIVPGWQTCHGFGNGVPVTNAVAKKITKTYLSTKRPSSMTNAYTTSSTLSSNASPASGPTSQARSTSTALPSLASVSQVRSQLPPGTTPGMPADSAGVSPGMVSGSEVSILHSAAPLLSEPSTESFSSPDGIDVSPAISPATQLPESSITAPQTNPEVIGGSASYSSSAQTVRSTPSSIASNGIYQASSTNGGELGSTVAVGVTGNVPLPSMGGSSPTTSPTMDTESENPTLANGRHPSIPGSAPPGSSSFKQASQSYIVVESSTYYDNSDGNYILGTQTYTPGSHAITISGQPISIPTHKPQPKTPSTRNFVVYDRHTFLANSAQNYVFGIQTYTPGDPAITATLTYPNSALPNQPPQTLTETISFPALFSPSTDPSSAWAPWHKGAVNAVMTWQHHTYTFYGDGNRNENVLSGHTLVTGGPPLTINGQTIWLDETGGLNAQYSPSDSGALPTPTGAEGVSSVPIGGMGGAPTNGTESETGTAVGAAGAATTSASRASRRLGKIWWRCWAGGLCSLGLVICYLVV